jgi:tetratricopeptide (TPR) repeat protein
MRSITCDACGQSQPMTGALRVRERTLCAPCAERFFAEHRPQDLAAGDVTPLVDPTVCHWCESDHGEQELGLIGGVGTCAACEQRLRNFPFPTWVKASFVCLLLAAIVSFGANFRYVRAVFDGAEGERAAARQDFPRAADLMERASQTVPGYEPYEFAAAFCRGLALMGADQSAEAVPYFKKCAKFSPDDATLQRLVLEAEIGAAFDAKDYDLTLAKSQELNALVPDDSLVVTKVASAHASKYAATGDAEHRRKAEELLGQARQLPGFDAPEMRQYEERIRHRLETREIIPAEEYARRFPNGWKPAEKAP